MARKRSTHYLCLLVVGVFAALSVRAAPLAPAIDLTGQGLSLTAAGVGLEKLGEGQAFLEIEVPDNVYRAYLYWGGRVWPKTEVTEPYGDQEIVFDPPVGGPVTLTGEIVDTLIFTEVDIAYVADVTDYVKAAGAGPQSFGIEDADLTRNLTRLVGAALVIIHTDQDDTGYYRLILFDGVDYAYGPNGYQTMPVTFGYDPSTLDRIGEDAAELLIVAGDGEETREDEIWVWWDPAEDPAVLSNLLKGEDGESLDTLFLDVDVPAGVGETTVQLVSPPLSEKVKNPDSLVWMVAGLRIPVPLAAIGDFVWEDLNKNGIQDEGEPAIEGVTVNLYDGEGAFVAQTTTDEFGYYEFTGLEPGDYYVEFVAPDGYAFTQPNQGADDEIDSDADPATGLTGVYTLAEWETNTTVDAGLYRLPTNPGTGTIGYWKTHSKAWPVDSIKVGCRIYSKQEAIKLMWKPPAGDMRWAMFPQLVAAKLNVIIGNDDSCIADTIAAADAWWCKYGGGRVRANSKAWSEGEPLYKMLDAYNNGRMCAPSRG